MKKIRSTESQIVRDCKKQMRSLKFCYVPFSGVDIISSRVRSGSFFAAHRKFLGVHFREEFLI